MSGILIIMHSTVSSLVQFVWHWSFYPCGIFQACLVGIVVPDPDFLPIWIKKKGIEGSYSELCNNKVRFITISSPKTQPLLLCMLTFFGLFSGCEERHTGGHPEVGQRSRTQVFWAGDCCHVWLCHVLHFSFCCMWSGNRKVFKCNMFYWIRILFISHLQIRAKTIGPLISFIDYKSPAILIIDS